MGRQVSVREAHMHTLQAVALAVLLAAGLPSIARAESLGEIAAKERARRSGKPTKVITEEDLKKSGKGTVSTGVGQLPADEAKKAEDAKKAAGGEKAEGAAKEEKKEKTEDELRTEREQDWRKRRDAADQEVQRLQAEVDRLQTYANDINVAMGPGRAELLERLEKAKQELEAARAKVAGLEDERRRAGFR
jgi:hypothetical protein